MSGFLNSNEEQVMAELDRFVKACKQNKSKPKEVHLSNRQMNVIRRVLEKAKENPDYDYARKFDLEKMTYCGFEIVEMPKLRPYHRRKDNGDLLEQVAPK